jgi:AcrR family transcriptional regulator
MPGAGRPPGWSREQITDAAVAIAEADGLDAVSMRRVAARLGTGAASLYRHLTTRDDLLDLMVEHAFARYEPVADTADWRSDVVAEFVRLLGFLRARP